MHPLALQPGARHRREPTTRQRIRVVAAALMGLALIAGFGVFGGTVLGGVSGQARVLRVIGQGPVGLHLVGWALCTIPTIGLFGLVMPTRSRIVRAVSLFLVIVGGAGLVVMSRPHGTGSASWRAALAQGGADASAFLAGVAVTSYALMAAVLVWALVAAVVVAGSRTNIDDLWAGFRRSAFWVAPIAIIASLAATVILAR